MKKYFIMLCFSFILSDSFNMELLSHVEFDLTCADITGFYQEGREFAVIGLANTVAFIDITDPYNPFEVGRIDGSNSTWRDLKYWNNHVYIGTEADDGIKVVDVSDLDNPTLVYTITDVDNSHNIHISDGYLYIVGADTYHMWIYDLSNPSNPELVGTWNDEYIHDLEVYNDKAYAMGIYTSTAYIIDLSDKSNPFTITSWQYPGMAHDCAITEDENYLVTADEMQGGYIRVWDIQDYNNISEVGYFIGNPQHSVHNVYIKDDLIYTSWYADGTRVFDMSDPTNIVEIAFYDTSEIEGLYVGNWGTYIYLPSNNIISSDMESGLYIMKLGGITISHAPLDDLNLNESININAEIEAFSGEIASANTYYNFGEGWHLGSMIQNQDLWEYVIPAPNQPSLVLYYIEAISTEGDVSYFPYQGEDEPILFMYGDLEYIIFDDFEADSGWQAGEDTAVGGLWERVIPNGTVYQGNQVQPDEDYSAEGDYCYITGNGVGESVGFDDIDGGITSIVSPVYNLEDHDSVLLTYFRWFTNNLGDNPSSDQFRVDVSDNNGLTWNVLEESNISLNNWERKRFILEDYINLTSDVIFRVQAEDIFHDGDFGSGGSLVEAGLDDFSIQKISSNILSGDVNDDEVLNVLDVVLTINFILDLEIPSNNQFDSADINSDGLLNVLDVVLLVNLILDN